MDLANAQHYVDGQFVSDRVQRIVEALKEYCPEIEVKWLPPGARREGQAAYCIMHCPPGQQPYVITYIHRDEDFTASVLARIIDGDQRNGEKSWDMFTAAEQAEKLIKRKYYEEAMEEANDIAFHVFRSRLNTYKVNKDLTIRE